VTKEEVGVKKEDLSPSGTSLARLLSARGSQASRREFLYRAGLLGLAAPLGLAGCRGFGNSNSKPGLIRLAYGEAAVCQAPVALALKEGIFAKHRIDVELVNIAAPEELLQSLSTGKADAGIGMIMSWLKPMEQGFDVQLVMGTHGGCSHLVGSKKAGVTDVKHLKGKTIAVSDVSGSSRNTFSILLSENGIDPNKDVEWKTYPPPLLGMAVEKNTAQAIAGGDPILYLIQKNSNGDLVEILSNLTPPWNDRVCCVLGVSGRLLRERRSEVRALASSLIEAADRTVENPEATAAAFAPHTTASVADVTILLRQETHCCHPTGRGLKHQVVVFTKELQKVGIMKASTDPAKFADRVVSDLFA
jgi:NitT/TauT family transport system substrate-binding protein